MNTFTIFAPAKLNLYLHVTGRHSDGYHTLESLVCFTDIGDEVRIESAEAFSFEITGVFAKSFKTQRGYLDHDNLVVRAARSLSQITNKALRLKITLVKNLPLSSGLGGGSSDAAATIWGLQRFWNLEPHPDYLPPLLEKLGADVPVCYRCAPSIMRGIGEDLSMAPDMPEIPVVIVNPGVPCPTADVFLHHNKQYKQGAILPKRFSDIYALVDFLKNTENDLYVPALKIVPEIENVINALQDAVFARMSGSGASCFGLFDSAGEAEKTAKSIMTEHPDWHVFTGTLNSPERY